MNLRKFRYQKNEKLQHDRVGGHFQHTHTQQFLDETTTMMLVFLFGLLISFSFGSSSICPPYTFPALSTTSTRTYPYPNGANTVGPQNYSFPCATLSSGAIAVQFTPLRTTNYRISTTSCATTLGNMVVLRGNCTSSEMIGCATPDDFSFPCMGFPSIRLIAGITYTILLGSPLSLEAGGVQIGLADTAPTAPSGGTGAIPTTTLNSTSAGAIAVIVILCLLSGVSFLLGVCLSRATESGPGKRLINRATVAQFFIFWNIIIPVIIFQVVTTTAGPSWSLYALLIGLWVDIAIQQIVFWAFISCFISLRTSSRKLSGEKNSVVGTCVVGCIALLLGTISIFRWLQAFALSVEMVLYGAGIYGIVSGICWLVLMIVLLTFARRFGPSKGVVRLLALPLFGLFIMHLLYGISSLRIVNPSIAIITSISGTLAFSFFFLFFEIVFAMVICVIGYRLIKEEFVNLDQTYRAGARVSNAKYKF